MTTDALMDWMRGHRVDPHYCRVHDAIVVFHEAGVGLCYGCVRDLRDELALATPQPRLAAFHACEHTTPVLGCDGGCAVL